MKTKSFQTYFNLLLSANDVRALLSVVSQKGINGSF